MNLSIEIIGFGTTKSNPRATKIYDSISLMSLRLTNNYSSSRRFKIIFPKLGWIGSSNFAPRRIHVVASKHSYSLGKFQWPIVNKKMSKILTAVNNVSGR